MKGFGGRLDRLSRGWVVLATGLVFAAFLFILLPQQARKAAAYAGQVGSPDTRFTYSSRQLYDIAQAYGVSGREAYVRARLTFDLAYPLTYGLFFSTTIAYTFRRRWPQLLGLRSLSVIPLWAMAADLVENLALVGVMRLYPRPSALLAALAAAATALKWVLVGASMLLAVVGLVALGVHAIRRLIAP